MMGGIVFKGKKDKPKEDNKVKTKAKKKTYITGLHGSGAAKRKVKIIFQVRRCKFSQTEFTPSFLYIILTRITENHYKIMQSKRFLGISHRKSPR